MHTPLSPLSPRNHARTPYAQRMMDDTLVYTSSYAPPRGCQDVYRCSEIIHSVAARTRCCRWNTCCAKTLRRQDTSAQLPPHLCAAYRALLGYLFPCCKATGRRAVESPEIRIWSLGPRDRGLVLRLKVEGQGVGTRGLVRPRIYHQKCKTK